jgi:uncharacterized protein (TIGR02118 family)
VESVEIRRRGPYEGGRAFGSAGAYERVDAVLHFAVDPSHPANAAITDLDRARRDADGRVRFEADLCVLRPVERAAAGRKLLVSVVNRGRKSVVPFSGPPPLEITDRVDPGDGFLLGQGYTVAFCGWQWDVERRPELVGLEAPRVADATARVTVQFQPNRARSRERLAHFPWHPAPESQVLFHRAYPVADLEAADARLSVRDGPASAPITIPRARWRFTDAEHVELEGGFEPGRTYAVSYTSAHCPVVGAGLLAIREAVAHLRAEDGIARVFGWGVSQTGRFLREFLHAGLNLDEEGRPVFDGLFIQVAGARRGEFNARGGQPSAQYVAGPWHEPPHDYAELLRAQRAAGGVPRIFHIDSANEYWRSEASLVHAEEKGTRDLEPPPEVRIYLLAGHHHLPGLPRLLEAPPLMPEARPGNALGTLNPAPLLRAALCNLVLWVAEGVEPPPSSFPRIAEGTAAARRDVLTRFAALPGVALPDPERLPWPDSACVVSTVDQDGNELAGVRHPEQRVPLGTHTGWNPRHEGAGAPGELLDMLGSTIPFARTEAERSARDDPRPSLEARYRASTTISRGCGRRRRSSRRGAGSSPGTSTRSWWGRGVFTRRSRPDPGGTAVIKLVYCLRKRDDVDKAEFHRYWLQEHGPLVRKLAAAIRARKYVQSHTVLPELNRGFAEGRGLAEPYEGITEVWWDSAEELRRGLESEEGRAAGRALAEDEARFIDFSRSRVFMTEEHLIFDL